MNMLCFVVLCAQHFRFFNTSAVILLLAFWAFVGCISGTLFHFFNTSTVILPFSLGADMLTCNTYKQKRKKKRSPNLNVAEMFIYSNKYNCLSIYNCLSTALDTICLHVYVQQNCLSTFINTTAYLLTTASHQYPTLYVYIYIICIYRTAYLQVLHVEAKKEQQFEP